MLARKTADAASRAAPILGHWLPLPAPAVIGVLGIKHMHARPTLHAPTSEAYICVRLLGGRSHYSNDVQEKSQYGDSLT